MARRLLRLAETLARREVTRTPHYDDVRRGMMTHSVKTAGQRACAWPEHEVDAIVAARVAGASDDEVRELVDRLHAARSVAYRAVLDGLHVEAGSR